MSSFVGEIDDDGNIIGPTEPTAHREFWILLWKDTQEYEDESGLVVVSSEQYEPDIPKLMEQIHVVESSAVQDLLDALEKIADPRKRDHKEPDAYTELGCVMHIAETALTKFREGKANE
jgi:hypothetical protein